jgi:hypothetical protein
MPRSLAIAAIQTEKGFSRTLASRLQASNRDGVLSIGLQTPASS